MLGGTLSPPDITLLSNSELDTLALRQGYPGLGALPDDEDVGDADVDVSHFVQADNMRHSPGSESALKGVLDVDDVEATDVLLTVHDDTATTPVTTTGDENKVAGIELDEVGNLALLNVETNGVVDLDGGVGETDTTQLISIQYRQTLVQRLIDAQSLTCVRHA